MSDIHEEHRKQFDLLVNAISLLQQSLEHLPQGGVCRVYKIGDRVRDFLDSDDVNDLYSEPDA